MEGQYCLFPTDNVFAAAIALPSILSREREMNYFTLFAPFHSLSQGILNYGSENTEFLLHLAADVYVMNVT